MEKHKLILLPLSLGLALLLYSWYLSYPLSISFPGDMVFNHVSLFYWIGLPLTLSSLYILGAFSKSLYLKCLVSVIAVIVIYSLFYFYYSMPTSDSQHFRGLTEYFVNTKDLNPSLLNHDYFQWPAFFIIAEIAVSVSGLEIVTFEFLLFTLIGSLMSITIFFYAAKLCVKGAFLSVIAFFFVLFYFINFQAVPFSLALSLVFVLFALETQEKNNYLIVTMIVIFIAISITHAFVGLFFVLYLLARSLIERNKRYTELFLLTTIVYLLVQMSLYWFAFNLQRMLRVPSEYGGMIQETLSSPALMPIDAVAQTVSRVITVTFALLCFVGLALLLVKKRLRSVDGAILISAGGYLAIGFVSYFLGFRALSIFFIPFSLGVACLLETRFKKYLKVVFLILLILFVFVPIHHSYNSFSSNVVPFQTKETYSAQHFLLNYYDWSNPSRILSHSPVTMYFLSVLDTRLINATFEDEYSSNISRTEEFDCIFYTIGLGNSFLARNSTLDKIVYEEKLSVIYDNGFSRIVVNSLNSPIA